MKKRNKLATVLAGVMLMSVMSVPVFADTNKDNINDSLIVKQGSEGENSLIPNEELENVEKDILGSITVSLTDGKSGTSKSGVEFSCMKVADVVDGSYVTDSAYNSVAVDLNNIKNADELESAATKFANVVPNDNKKATDINGTLKYEDLEVGVYLLECVNDSKYDNVTPFLVAIPTWSEKDGDMLYDISVNPKHSPKPSTPTSDKVSPQTGVYSPIIKYFGIAGALLIVLFTFNVVMRKRDKKKEK